jgi:hypothetical protein
MNKRLKALGQERPGGPGANPGVGHRPGKAKTEKEAQHQLQAELDAWIGRPQGQF